MSFPPNPLSLSLPEPAFESWLRDSGYLEILDHRTTQLHHLHSTPSTTTTAPTTTTTPTITTTATTTTTITALIYTLTMSFISSLATILSLFTLNPFAKLTSSDFADDSNNNVTSSVNWTSCGFLGCFDTYSFPSSTTQARMRVHENVKRFARQYTVLSLVFFACSLYQMPLALIGLVSCLAVWELFRFCDARWALERFPSSRQLLIRAGQCAVAAILFWCNVQVAVFCTMAVSYAVLIMHASFRKLTPAKQPLKRRAR